MCIEMKIENQKSITFNDYGQLVDWLSVADIDIV